MDTANKKPGTWLIIGPYRIPLTWAEFIRWEKDVMLAAGFTKGAIVQEIKRRMGLC